MATLDPVIQVIRQENYQAKNLKTIFKNFLTILSDVKDQPWEKRDDCLRKIAGMAMAHVIDDREFGESIYKDLGRILAEQVLDLRSQIVRSACATVVVLSNELSSNFDTTFEQFILPALIKQLPVKAQPIRESANDCIALVIAHHENPGILRPLYNASTEKEKIIRGRVAEYLFYICSNWDKDLIQKNLGSLLGNIKPMLQDGSDIVRDFSRQSLITLSKNFPLAVAQFLQTIDPKVIKLLENDLPEEVLKSLTQKSAAPQSSQLGVPQQVSTRRSTGGIGAPTIVKGRLSGGSLSAANDNSNVTPQQQMIKGRLSGGSFNGQRPNMQSTPDLFGGQQQQQQQQQNVVSLRTRSETEGEASNHSVRLQQQQQKTPQKSQAQAMALASLGNVDIDDISNSDFSSEKRGNGNVPTKKIETSDPAELLKRLQMLRSEVLKTSSSRDI